MVEVVAGSGERADQERPASTMLIRNSRDVAIRVTPGHFALRRLILLQEIPTVDLAAVHIQLQLIQQVGRELDIAFASTKELIKSVVRLFLAGMTVIAEVCRQTLADQCSAILNPCSQPC